MTAKRSQTPVKADRFTFRISPDLRGKLQKIADLHERTPSYIVEKCLAKFLQELEKKEPSFNGPEHSFAG